MWPPTARRWGGSARGRRGRTLVDGIAEAHAAMDERRAVKSLVRVGTV
jgi:hypothetical protein